MFRSKATFQQHAKNHTQNKSVGFESNLQTFDQLGDNSNFSSHVPHGSVRPPVPYNVHQNSSSSSTHSHFQPNSYKPILHQPTTKPNFHESMSFEPCLHNSSPSYHLDGEQDQLDGDEMKLLAEVEIIDEKGSVLRIQKMTTKDVYRLKQGEKILVHVNDFGQPIKAAGGICLRFMTFLLKQPNLCPPEARDWKELKVCSGVKLLGELRRKFSLPQREIVDKVIFAYFDVKFRTIKHRFKMQLFRLATEKLNEANNIVDGGEQEGQYSEEDLLQALDLVEVPTNFLDHQWELYKSNLRTPTAKKLSQYGKKARASQVHIRTTGAVSFARKKDEFKMKHKREANDVEFFGISYQTKKGSYVRDSSRELMERAQEEISRKLSDIGSSENVDAETQSEIERDVMTQLMGQNKPGRTRGYGTGVTKSQVTKFSFDLRRMRGEGLTNHNRVLLDKVESQSKQIESQNKQIESQSKQIESQSQQMKTMQGKMDEFTRDLQIFKNAFKNLSGASSTE